METDGRERSENTLLSKNRVMFLCLWRGEGMAKGKGGRGIPGRLLVGTVLVGLPPSQICSFCKSAVMLPLSPPNGGR